MRNLFVELYTALFVPRFRYGDAASQMRARFVLAVAIVTSLACLVMLLGLAFLADRTTLVTTAITGTLAGLLVQMAIIGLIHAGQLRAGMYAYLAFMQALAITISFGFGVSAPSALLLSLPIVITSILWGWGGVLLVTFVQLALLAAVGALESQGTLQTVGAATTASLAEIAIRPVVAFGLLSILGLASSLISYEVQRAQRSTGRLLTQLRAMGEVAQIVPTTASLEELLRRTVDYVRDRFAFYHVQVFLVDQDRRYANLAASTGDLGAQLMQRGYRLAVNAQSAIGNTLQTGETSLVASTEVDTPEMLARRTNELLRDTRSELVLPLVIGDQVIGALDIQSTRLNTFTLEIAENMRGLAGHIAVAIHNMRNLDENKGVLNDTRRQLLEAEVNLREAHRLNQRLTGQAWEDYLKSRSAQIIGYTLQENRLQRDSSWTSGLELAAGRRRPNIMSNDNDGLTIAVPIELRGRSIGAIEVEMRGTVRQAETLDVLQSVAQRLALSIDNARLFEQAQELAQRELEVNTITGTLQGINDIEMLARVTIQELSRALGAAHASIRLGNPIDLLNSLDSALSAQPGGR